MTMTMKSKDVDKSERSMMLPNRFVKIGETRKIDGIVYDVVERPPIDRPSQVCKGCDLRSRNCDRVQCSKWDRVDGKNVWFIEHKEERDE